MAATRRPLRFALAHEWSHLTRGDVRTWLLAGLVRIVHFYQPLVWLLRRQLRLSQDFLADAAAAGAGTPEDYAEFLTSVSRGLKPARLALGLGIAGGRTDLHRRVVMLVEKHGTLERKAPKRWNLVVLIVGLATVAAIASLRAEPRAAKAQTKSPVIGTPAGDAGPSEASAQSAVPRCHLI